jgi:hypothetical protein
VPHSVSEYFTRGGPYAELPMVRSAILGRLTEVVPSAGVQAPGNYTEERA